LIECDRTAEAQALRRADPDWRSDPVLRVELSNLLATQVRARALLAVKARFLPKGAEQRVTEWVEVPHAEALAVAMGARTSACDARFVACARQLAVPLVTEDPRLRAAAPDLTMSMAQPVSGAAG
jgi:predicted nucleic acid-binding protein